MEPIVTPEEMRAIDANASAPIEELIARAAWHVARRARSMLGGVYGRRVTVIAGPGNNGEDARVAAELLARWGVRTAVVAPDVETLPAADLVIDGAFGTGMNRGYISPPALAGVPVLAIDIPSGLDGLTGQALTMPLRADHTVTFAAHKPGLLLSPGNQYCGRVELVDIGLDVSSAQAWLLTADDVARLLPIRGASDHKWKRAVWVIGGSSGMYGAPLLAANAALRSGAGMVWCGLPGQGAPGIASEIVFRSLDEDAWHEAVLADVDRFGSLVVGCGLGRSSAAGESLQALVDATACPIVLDGDALRLLGQTPQLRANIVLTPHDGEFEALTGSMPGADRFGAARELAAATGATVLLKGPLTIVASPDGQCLASDSGDRRLATAGTGDVLAGMIGSYLAAGVSPREAAAIGAWMHGECGRSQPEFGMVASDLVASIGQVSARLVSAAAPHGEPHASY